MSSPPETGLRERKKAKTRAAIQAEALRLFREHGYAATTVEQIADAAEVSPSTFFRYFGTKEDVVLHDRFDPLLFAAFRAQPPELTPIQALRAAMRAVFDGLPPAELERERLRGELILAVPELRARALAEFADTLQATAGLVAERVGRSPDDFEVRIFTGAVMGVALAAVLVAAEQPAGDYLALMDEGLAALEAGLPL
ncbi:MAG TPA: TetR family transcriptional regulator [Gaiellaceae bacterium]|nr:TetR family transcriptional regulator [Gaiellaceae bacterium]